MLQAVTTEGDVLEGPALRGLQLPFVTTDGEIEYVTLTEATLSEAGYGLYELEYEGQSLCDDDASGIFVPGTWDETGKYHESLETENGPVDAVFSCPAGVIMKCVTWGYEPWVTYSGALAPNCPSGPG